MSRKVKCPTCSEWFIREDVEHIFDEKKKRYYHIECYNKGEAKLALDRENLYKTMCDIFGYEYVVQRIRKQINDMIEEYNYTFRGIELTLDYMYRIAKMDKEKANGGVGLVPWFYKIAGEFYRKKMDIWDSGTLNYESIEIKISVKNKPKTKNKKIIDIGGL